MTILYQSTQNRKCQPTEKSIPVNETNYTYPTSRIGNTNYRFKVRFSQDAEETLEEKVWVFASGAEGAPLRNWGIGISSKFVRLT